MKYTNEELVKKSKSLSDSEKRNCESTVNVVKTLLKTFGFSLTNEKAIDNDDGLDYGFSMKKDNHLYTVLLQGSYGNGTGVRRESDVDISIICEDVWIGNYTRFSARDYNFCDSSFSILDLKSQLSNFINNHYPSMVRESNKCIDFAGNGSSRKNVDIVPALRYRDYSNDLYCNPNNYVKGICIKTRNGMKIINYPEQTRDNSIHKNNETNYYYKKIVRIIKSIKSDMEDEGNSYASSVSSFGLESLLYNVPNDVINGNYDTMCDRVIAVIDYLVSNKGYFCNYKEPNGILNIFDNSSNDIEVYRNFIVSLKRYVQ